MEIKTNNHSRPLFDAFELSDSERKEFDYIPWDQVDDGSFNAGFFRYKGRLYDTDQFLVLEKGGELFEAGWHGYAHDTAFSGVVIKLSSDGESVIVGTYFC